MSLDEVMDALRRPQILEFSELHRAEAILQHNPFDLIRLYDAVIMGQLVPEEGTKQSLESGLVGYIKGQKLKAVETAEALSITDPLTGLLNRRGYEGMLEGVLKKAERAYQNLRRTDAEEGTQEGEKLKDIALIILDVNNFKEEANDKYGHEFGDKVLKYVTDAIMANTRAYDIQARLGGDEFVIILNPLDAEKPEEFLIKLTNKINLYLRDRINTEHPDKKSNVSVSLGMSVYKKDAELASNADSAMYYAKTHPVPHPAIDGNLVNCHIYDAGIKYITREERRERVKVEVTNPLG